LLQRSFPPFARRLVPGRTPCIRVHQYVDVRYQHAAYSDILRMNSSVSSCSRYWPSLSGSIPGRSWPGHGLTTKRVVRSFLPVLDKPAAKRRSPRASGQLLVGHALADFLRHVGLDGQRCPHIDIIIPPQDDVKTSTPVTDTRVQGALFCAAWTLVSVTEFRGVVKRRQISPGTNRAVFMPSSASHIAVSMVRALLTTSPRKTSFSLVFILLPFAGLWFGL